MIIFGQEHKKKKKRRRYEGKQIASFTELSVGDFVVHENHGLGVYRGHRKVEVDHVTKDYMKIEYAGGSSLYVPATQLDVIQKYADGDAAKAPKLNKLGTQEWNRTKTRVRTAVRQIAQDLVKPVCGRPGAKRRIHLQRRYRPGSRNLRKCSRMMRRRIS